MSAQQWVLILLAGIILATALLALLIRQLRYEIGPRHLRIRLLGLTLRRIRLDQMGRISKRRTGPAENWSNTFKGSHRRLVIRKKSGLFKQIIITPEHRYTFRKHLEEAIQKTQNPPPPGQVPT